MGTIAVHEFISLDGVFENPTWTSEFGFDPAMGETLGAITGAATAILLGRTTYEMFAPAWSTRTVEDDPGAPFFNETDEVRRRRQEPAVEWGTVDPARRLRRRRDPTAQGRAPTASSTSPAAARWSGRCSRTGWSTTCTCSSTRSRSARAAALGRRGRLDEARG